MKQHQPEIYSTPTRLQDQQHRFTLVFAVVLPILILVTAAFLFFMVVTWGNYTWWKLGGGLVLLAVAAVGGATFMVKRYFLTLAAEIEPLSVSETTIVAETIPTNGVRVMLPIAETAPHQDSYRCLIELLPNGVIMLHGAEICFINHVGAAMLGAAHPQELTGELLTTFIPPNQQALFNRQILSAGKNRPDINPFEQTFIQADGSQLQVELSLFSLEFQNKPTVGLVIRNITGHKQAEVELTQRNRELTILQAAGLAITSRLDLRYVLDTVAKEMTSLLTIESCTIFEYLPAENSILQIAQYSPAGWWNAASPAKKLRLAEFPLTRAVVEEQIPEQLTISQPNADPTERAYMQAMQLKTRLLLPMVYQQQVVGLVDLSQSHMERTFSYQEISLSKHLANLAASAIEHAKLYRQAQQEIIERKRAEADLAEERSLLAQRVKERTEELSKVNAELAKVAHLKDEFLASMSHELRTPLNAILGSSEILQTEVFGPVNEKQLKYLRNTEESGRHLLSLINDILDLSKIEAGKFEIEIRPVAVNSICQASLRLVKQLAHQKQLTLMDTYDEAVTRISGDERRLKQILVNLLSNAIKFTPQGGQVGLDVIGDPEQEQVHFVVWDTGIGIAPQDMAQLFQPFVQLDSALSRQYAGTGLGLSLVSRLTELHGGGISVESEVDKGSRFTVSLPWVEAADTQDMATASPAVSMLPQPPALLPAAEQPLVLLADDNEHNINTILDFLQIKGYRVVIARNGKEAIERAKEDTPHIILMDIQMPEMDGLEAIRRLRQDPQTQAMPIIAITALAMPGDKEKCLIAGANKYLSKPVSPVQLASTIEMCLHEAR